MYNNLIEKIRENLKEKPKNYSATLLITTHLTNDLIYIFTYFFYALFIFFYINILTYINLHKNIFL